MAALPQTCADCSKPLCGKNRSGYCARHHNQQPDKRASISAGVKRAYRSNPEFAEAQRQRNVRNAHDPAINAKRSAAAKRVRLWEHGIRARTPETYAKIVRTQRAMALAWCPPHLRDDYRRLRAQRFSAAEARRLVLDQDAAEVKRWQRSVGVETPAPVMLKPLVGGSVLDRAASVAAQWAGVEDIWCEARCERLVRARWSVMLALDRRDYSQCRIARETGLDRSTVRYCLPRAQALAARPGEFADLFAMVMAA